MDGTTVAAIVAALFGGGGAGAVIVKWQSKPVDDATAHKLKAEAKATAQETASGEVQILRDIIAEVRLSEAKKQERLDSMEVRLAKLEERERHALTRAAVHEAWDQLTFQVIQHHVPNHPPPPPLRPDAIEPPRRWPPEAEETE
ncbi:hypothetical protein NOK12_16390 [Nocardioides sp. OK12]|uniref:hypothetical protein n=1 Tax=Nocardioides sp. OK12 TaxID=2758661 RepID=UPI0021C25BEE|nr:hypothetical protein [Nocardioides sp. OK12]GHJ59121.1 hypothetical protein NOK12_16390 [Nocardioides sp. OK12]